MTSSSSGVGSVGVLWVIGSLCVLALGLNVLVVVLTCRKPLSQRLTTSVFILNLAASDLILAGVTIPLILMDAHIAEAIRSDVECKLKMSLPLFNVFTSVVTMVLMSYDRLRVIVMGRVMSRVRARQLMAGTWVLGVVLTAPQLYEYRLVDKWDAAGNYTELACSSQGRDPLFIRTYAVCVLLLGYILPAVCLIKNYGHVVFYVTLRAGAVEGQVTRARVQVLRTVIAISVAFVVLWLPFFVLFTIEEITGTDDSSLFTTTPHVVKQVLVTLSALSNPVLYFFLLPDYRLAFRRLLPWRGRVHPSGSPTDPAPDTRTAPKVTHDSDSSLRSDQRHVREGAGSQPGASSRSTLQPRLPTTDDSSGGTRGAGQGLE